MSDVEHGRDAAVGRLLAGAAQAIAGVRYCWLVTGPGAGIAARPMGRLPRAPGDDDWTIRFVVDDRSRKVADIGRDAAVAVIFQRAADDAYVAASGRAALRPGAAEDGRLWKPAYDAYFPTIADRAHAAFLELAAERLELWIRGVTPEPFGLRPTCLARPPGGAWRLLSAPGAG
ncbi:MAG TPA: pyridoxamine 5'-phosphate oxidase family protein [Stellaceae bacterium]|nr:pyridoxamine 5'-phosphate oxidase family protein [Stellaceae bacterium]